MSFSSGLIIISSVAGVFWLAFLFFIRQIHYFAPNTDNKYLVHTAAQSSRWRWLSDIHKFGEIKTGMMEMTIIGIAFFQKLFRDKEGDRPYIAWGGFTAAITAVMIYLIGAGYWNADIGLALGLLLIVSFWLWQVALYGGHANTAAVLALASVYLIQQTHTGTFSPTLWLFLGGIVYGLTQFSSRSAVKYTPLFFGAVFYEKYQTMTTNFLFYWNFNAILIGLITLSFLTLKLIYKRLVIAIYFEKAPVWLNKIISNRQQLSLDYYLQHANNKISFYFNWAFKLSVLLLLAVNLLELNYLLPVVVGAVTALLVFTLPNIKENLKYTFNNVFEHQVKKKSHFRLYVDYFAKKGIAVSRDTLGGGWRWLPKVFFRLAPWHSVFFLLSTAGLLAMAIFDQVNLVNVFLVTIMALSPILWAQLTGASQCARTFSPGLVAFPLATGYLLSATEINFWFPFLIIIALAFLWNLWKFFTDIYPARMVGTNLTNTLLSLKIKEFYTYDTEYNNTVVNIIDPAVLKDIKINYVQSLKEVKDGWIIIPDTSSKAMHMSSARESIREGDYTKDPVLNELLETRRIEKIATAKFKTFGSSNIWVQESEVSGYRDLILKEITNQDRFRGYAWLLHSSQLATRN